MVCRFQRKRLHPYVSLMAKDSPPPFVPDPDLVQLIGVDGLGLMVWLVGRAEPATDYPGGFCVSGSVRDLCTQVGWHHTKFAGQMKALHAMGLVWIQPGMRFGRGGGSTPQRYFVLHSPDLTSPGPNRGSRFTDVFNRDVQNQHPQSSGDNVVHRDRRHLIAAPFIDGEALEPDDGTMEMSGFGMSSKSDDVLLTSHHQQVPVGGAETRTSKIGDVRPTVEAIAPPFAVNALKAVGWVGAPPAVDDWDLLAAVALHIASQKDRFRNPAGFLRRLVDQEALTAFSSAESLKTSSAEEANETAIMPFAEYTRTCIDNPGWEQVVSTEALRRAQVLGVPLSMALKRTVALEIPLLSATRHAKSSSGADQQ